MITAWMEELAHYVQTVLIPCTEVVVRKPRGVFHPPQAISVEGIIYLARRLRSARFVLSQPNTLERGSLALSNKSQEPVKQSLGVVATGLARRDDSRTRPQSNAGRMMLTERLTAHASPLALGVRGDSAYSLPLALRKNK